MVKGSKRSAAFPVKNVLLGVAIALVFVFFIAYATESFYPSPDYEDYCGDKPTAVIGNAEDCNREGGMWSDYDDRPAPSGQTGWCDWDFECRKNYDLVREPYGRNVFFVNIILGLIVVVSSFVFKFETVSNGFMGGGILLLVYGSIRYWGELSDIWRTLVLGLALVLLISLAYKKLKD